MKCMFRLSKAECLLKRLPIYDDLCSRCLPEPISTLRNLDALLVPTAATPILLTTEIDADIMETYTERNLSYLRNIAIDNVLNHDFQSSLDFYPAKEGPLL